MNGLYSKLELKKPGFFNRLFGLHDSENALIEVNNLFASKPIMSITIQELDELLVKYNSHWYVQCMDKLKAMYSTYLSSCLKDNTLSLEERDELRHMKSLLRLSDQDVKEIHRQLAAPKYQEKVNEILADSRLTDQEEEELNAFEKSIGLQEEYATELLENSRRQRVGDHWYAMISDQRVSESEEKELEAICSSLGVTINIDDKSQENLIKFRNYWQIENLPLLPLDVNLNLLKGELCYQQESVVWMERRMVTTSIRYGGPAMSFRIAKGLYYRAGGYQVQRMSEEATVEVDEGKLYLTNQRVIFVGNKKSVTLKLEKILQVIPYSDGLEISKGTGKNILFQFIGHADLFTLKLGRLLQEL